MTPFEIWLLGSVIAPDAYTRVVDRLRGPQGEKRAMRHVKGIVGDVSPRTFLRWYRLEPTWSDLVEGGSGAYKRLVDSMITVSRRRPLRGAMSRQDAEDIVTATAATFIQNLDPSDAVAVADYRSAVRDVVHDQLEEARALETQTQVSEGFRGLHSRLDADATFDERLAALPALVRPLLVKAESRAGARRLVDLVTSEDPQAALVALVSDLPDWLANADGATLVAAAELARTYRVHTAAGTLFELAADVVVERAYFCARAAAEFAAAERQEKVDELLDKARRLGATPPVVGIEAAMREDPEAVLSAVTHEVAIEDPYLVSVRFYGLRRLRETDDEISFLTEACERYPEAPGLLLELAWAFLHRSQSPTATSRTMDRSRALDLALQARDLRREWRGDSGEAVRVACQAALLLGDYDRTIALGLTPPTGEAFPREAAHQEVRLAVAQAAIAAGNVEIAQSVVELAPQGFNEAIVRADVLHYSGADPETVAGAYGTAWAAAEHEQEKVLLWLSAAGAGMVDLPGQDELAARDDEIPVLVEAQQLIAVERFQAAVSLLRSHRKTESTSRLLVAALRGLGDIDGAVFELRDAATRFNDATHLVRAVELLGGAGRIEDAAESAQEALQRVPHALTAKRAFLHEVLVERAGVAGAWGEMAVRARAWIEDVGPSRNARWNLVLALFNSGDQDEAWQALQEAPALHPETAHEARLWTLLAAKHDAGPIVCARIIDLVDRFPGDEGLGEVAVRAFFMMGDDGRGDPGHEIVTRFQQLLEKYAIDIDSAEDAAIVRVTGSAEEMLEKLRPQLEAQSRALAEMADKVRDGWPYGLLAAAVGRPYAAALMHRAAGCLPIATADQPRMDRERGAAREALGGNVCIDVSVVVIGWYLRGSWPALRTAFARLETPAPARRDALAALEGFRARSDGALYFDRDADAVRGRDEDLGARARLLKQAEWIDNELDEVSPRDWARLVAVDDADRYDETFLPWMSPIDMAKKLSMPLWCDDLGIRTLAEQGGVRTFGTVALLDVLLEAGRITAADARSALRMLRQEYAVDLPRDDEWLRLSAASAGWRAGPATFYFTRPTSWASFPQAWDAWSDLVQAAASADPALIEVWVHAAAIGAGRSVNREQVPPVLAALAAKGIVLSAFEPKVIAACAARIRQAARDVGLGSPVPQLVSVLLLHLSETVGAQRAAQLLDTDELDEPDRDVVRELLFGVRPSGGPLDA